MDDDLDALRGWRARLAEPDADTLTATRARLLSEASREPGRNTKQRRLSILVPAAGLAAVVAVAAGFVVTSNDDPAIDTQASSRSQLKMVSAGVSQLLHRAADRVADEPAAPPSADQWIYEKRLVSVGTADGLTFSAVETWLRADGAKVRRSNMPVAVDENGSKLTDENGVMDAGLEGDDQAPLDTYSQLQAWPQDPDQLLMNLSRGDLAGDRGPAEAFAELTAALRDAPFIPPAQHEAIFKALAEVPGVQMQDAEDAAGRRGIAIGRQDVEEGVGGTRGQRYEVILDADSYEYLGDRIVALGAVPANAVHDGNVLNASARLETAIVDGPRDRP